VIVEAEGLHVMRFDLVLQYHDHVVVHGTASFQTWLFWNEIVKF
jgi:hypothetical protein